MATDAPATPKPDDDLSATIATLQDQEHELVFRTFTNDDAWRLGCLLVERARAGGLAVVVDVRRGEQQLFHAALDGTSAHNDSWVERKSRVVARFGVSTYLANLREVARGRTFGQAHELPFLEYAAAGGAFPVRVAGVGVVGSVAVSGLSQHDDHELVVAGIREFLSAAG
ncbi:heme-degrading domain-containing protein [Luteimicrobium sp. NPDC057192]|uniref:heme-degrading domain-containing protein n=1 Tax=Luteimicrobium sp. NPDC057192 TaxID=3346042 RepID=UPI00362B4E09